MTDILGSIAEYLNQYLPKPWEARVSGGYEVAVQGRDDSSIFFIALDYDDPCSVLLGGQMGPRTDLNDPESLNHILQHLLRRIAKDEGDCPKRSLWVTKETI